MSIKIGEAYVDLSARMDKYEKSLKDAQGKLRGFESKSIQSTKSIESSFANIAKGALAAFAVFKTGQVILNKFVKTASDAQETNQKFAVTFRDVSKEAEKAAKSMADSYGLAQNESKKLLSDTGDLLSGFGFTGAAALDLSTQVNELAVDLASFTNLEGGAERASAALTKALLGERESAKLLGIAILEEDVKARLAAKGQQNLTGTALRQAKAQATLELAYEQSKNAIGDFARSQNSYANIQRRINARTKDFTATLGKSLLPGLESLGLAFLETSKDGGFLAKSLDWIFSSISKALSGFALLMTKMKQWRAESDVSDSLEQTKLLVARYKELSSELKNTGMSQKELNDIAASGNIPENIKLTEQQKDSLSRLVRVKKMMKDELDKSNSAMDENASIQNTLNEIAKRGNGITDEAIQKRKEERAINEQANNKDIEDEKKKIEAAEETYNKRMELAQNYMSATTDLFSALNEVFAVDSQNRIQEIDTKREKQLKQINDTFEAEKDKINKEVKNKKKADKMIAKLEEEKAEKEQAINEKADKQKKKIQREEFKRNQAMQIVNAVINTAQAVVAALAAPMWPASIGFAAFAAAAGAAQIAAIASQKPPALAAGGIAVGETLATIGEAGAEAVFPLEGSRGRKTTQMFADNVVNAIESQSNRSNDRFGTIEEEKTMTFNVHVNVGSDNLFGQITQGIENREILIDERSLVKR